MTCANLFEMMVINQNLTIFVVLFAAGVVGVSVTVMYFHHRYRKGIAWQRREDEQARAFKGGA